MLYITLWLKKQTLMNIKHDKSACDISPEREINNNNCFNGIMKKNVTPKIIAMYLPQFHNIPENDEFWGKGFTDWVTVRNAKPLYQGHHQPVTPLNENYYDLSKIEDVEWQCKLASDHGIYAFGVYHYWFNDEKNLLTKPAEIMRDSNTIQTKYFFSWDNCNWARSWGNVKGNDWSPTADARVKKEGPHILLEYILGTEENWRRHYDYLKSHFISSNYLKIGNKPVFAIINYDERIGEMIQFWNELAHIDGFDGIFVIYKYKLFLDFPKNTIFYNYEPHFSAWGNIGTITRIKNAIIRWLKIEKDIYFYDYDKVWKNVLKNARMHSEANFYHGAFVSYDDSPRRGNKRSRIVRGATPAKFEKYMSELITICKDQCKEFIFLTAWNEWSEGAFMEPDMRNSYGYLDALKKVTDNANNRK